jgi:hypothetical protein
MNGDKVSIRHVENGFQIDLNEAYYNGNRSASYVAGNVKELHEVIDRIFGPVEAKKADG